MAAGADRFVEAFRSRLVPGVLDDEALVPVARTLSACPPIPMWVVVEMRLAGEAPAVDLLAGVLRDPVTLAALASDRSGPLRGVPDFVATWSADGSPCAGSNVLWLEWDDPAGSRGPLLLYGVDERFWPRAGRVPDGLAAGERIVALRRAAGAPADPRREEAIARFASSLPPHARLLCSARLGPRGLDLDRMFVGLTAWDVGPWLEAWGWCGERSALEWLHRMVAPWETAWLQVEVGDGPQPYLAIETPQAGPGTAGALEASIFDWLPTQGVAKAHLDALRSWRGLGASGALEERRSFHVKVVLRPGRAPVLKGYFGVHYTNPG